MSPLNPKYTKRFVAELSKGDQALPEGTFTTRTGAIWDITNDQMVYRFEVLNGKSVYVCNLPVPAVLVNQKVDIFDLADQAAKHLKTKIHENA